MTMVVESLRPRAGRRFAPSHELALLAPAVDAAAALPGAHRGLLVVQEATGPYGIPDLTALVGPPALLAERLALDVPALLHQVDAAVAAVAHPRVGRSSSSLARLLGWPPETVERRLPDLVRVGALQERGPDRYVRPEALRPLGRMYAVETKVRDWSRALRQVRRYSVWADGYVLVMGELSARPLELLRVQVASDRGGLVVGGRWVRRPAVQKLPPARRLWAAEYFVAAVREGYQPSPVP
ncbi:hypothetical protein [Blastococcus sp. SYSU DS1024]